MDKPAVVIWGASDHAQVVADIIRLCGDYDLVGFLDNIHVERKGALFADSIILGGVEQLDVLGAKGVQNILIGVGDCRARLQLAEIALAKGFSLTSAIHPSAVIARGVTIGPGTVIAAGVVINPQVKIGGNVIVNTGSCIEHGSIIADGAHIGTGVHLGGNVQIGRAVSLGVGSTVDARIVIGDFAHINCGAVVLHDVPRSGL